MRISCYLLLLLLPLLLACKILPADGDASRPPPTEQGNFSETALDDQGSRAPSDAVRPKPRPDAQGAVQPETKAPAIEGLKPIATISPDPVVRKSKEQVTCEKRGGNWGTAGKSGGKTCIKRTRDSGKQCRKKSSCEGVCLARSGTCAPVTPLFGCNDILQNDGSRVTLCVD